METAETAWVLGIDIGGTFTDGVAIDANGRSVQAKVPTTIPDRERGVFACVDALAEAIEIPTGDLLARTTKFAHGQTTTVNAMVERKGARTGLITTAGFGDTLRIMNISRNLGLPPHEAIDGIRGGKPAPLVPAELTQVVDERVDQAGNVVRPLDEESVRRAVRSLVTHGVEAIAVTLLWSFQNPAHEQRVAEIAQEEAPAIPVTLSHEIAPVIGEYERTVTSVTNAYVAPALAEYVDKLADGLAERGLEAPCLIMQSNGGLIPASDAPRLAATTLVSGLSGGVMGSLSLGESLGLDNVIACDMGGTSFEVSLILDKVPLTASYPLAPRLGPNLWRWRLAVPTIDITAIGSGGGSIAWLDRGVLKVGPRSAQAVPGPACYGTGGTEPTITDADLVLGYLDPDNFLGGRMKIYPELAEKAIRTKIAEPLGLDVLAAAAAIAEVANDQMADLLRGLTVNKGYDPRDFHLVAFGGAGPLHVGQFGPDLGVRGMIVPGRGLAAAQSAFGVAAADYRQSYVRSFSARSPFEPALLETRFRELEAVAVETFLSWGVERDTIRLARSADMRWRRQFNVVEVRVEPSLASAEDAEALVAAFAARYEALFGAGTAVPEAGVEITNLRVSAVAPVVQTATARVNGRGPSAGGSLMGTRPVYIPGGRRLQPVEIHAGERLQPETVLTGPCVVEYPGSTVFVSPSQRARVDALSNVVIELVN